MTELTIEPRPCGYAVFHLGVACEWDPESGRLWSGQGNITLFADQFAAETAVEKTSGSIAKTRDWSISAVRRARAKENLP